MAGTGTLVFDPGLGERRPGTPSGRGGDFPPSPAPVDTAPPPPVSNARLATLVFIVFESMLFAGLLGGYTVERWGSVQWPPSGQPYLPIAVTWINTFVLLGSCVPLWLAGRAFLRADRKALLRGLVAATVMGAAFLAIQGMEWTRLVTHGLTVAHGVYGGLFVILIGTHALHVLGAVVWLAIVTGFALAGRLRGPVSESFDMVRMYWVFVAAVWIALFAMVYLA